MKTRIVCVLALLALALPALAQPPATEGTDESVRTMRIDGDLTIDPQGKVLDYRITTPLRGQINGLLDKAVRHWTFQPVLVDGQPVTARTGMRITLGAREVESGYAVAIDNVTFHNKEESATGEKGISEETPEVSVKARSLVPPKYPSGLMRSQVSGGVMLMVRVTPSGDVADLAVVQSAVYNVKGQSKTLAMAREKFEDSVLAVARRWKFDVTAKLPNPDAEALTLAIPVQFVAFDTPADPIGTWRVEQRGPLSIAPWLVSSQAQRIGISDVDSNAPVPVATRFHLNDEVRGRAL